MDCRFASGKLIMTNRRFGIITEWGMMEEILADFFEIKRMDNRRYADWKTPINQIRQDLYRHLTFPISHFPLRVSALST